MNSTLINYGIQEEDSDIRAHVSPVTQRIYVFKTMNVIRLLENSEYQEVPGYQPGIHFPTAKGNLIPPFDIPDLRVIEWNDISWWKYFNENDDTDKKGRFAVYFVKKIMQAGRFPLWFDAKEITDIDIDIKGTDILVKGKWKIQVKCDFKAGPKEWGGTGNLFIQLKECNPLGKH